MRITQKMMTDTVNQSLLANRDRLYRLNRIVSTGKRINEPSDDPRGKAKTIEFRATLASIDQYMNNISRGRTRLEVTEQVLNSMEEHLQSVRTIALNGLKTASENEGLAAYISSIRDQVTAFANYRYENQYIFAGGQSDTAPFLADGTYVGDDGDVGIMTGSGVEVKINTAGSELFNITGGTADIFTALADLEAAFIAGDAAQVEAQRDIIDETVKKINAERTVAGMTQNRLAIANNYWTHLKPKMELSLIEIENADMTEAVVELRSLETAYEAALNVAARVIQPTLLDYL